VKRRVLMFRFIVAVAAVAAAVLSVADNLGGGH
jgi:hypothetical protein